MSDWVIGLDTHRYNGPVNYRIARQAGAQFVLSRCGGGYQNTGQPFVDDQWGYNASSAPPIIPCFGAWWYLSGHSGTIYAQASKAAELVIPYKEKLTLGFWLDCEWWLAGVSASENRDMTLRFIDTFEARANMPVRGIYTRQTIWDPYVAPHERWSRLDLWAGRYNSMITGPWADGRYHFRDWPTWKFWQYSADGNGQASRYGVTVPPADPDIDLDRWVGSLDSLRIYAGLQEAPLTYEDKVDILWADYLERKP